MALMADFGQMHLNAKKNAKSKPKTIPTSSRRKTEKEQERRPRASTWSEPIRRLGFFTGLRQRSKTVSALTDFQPKIDYDEELPFSLPTTDATRSLSCLPNFQSPSDTLIQPIIKNSLSRRRNSEESSPEESPLPTPPGYLSVGSVSSQSSYGSESKRTPRRNLKVKWSDEVDIELSPVIEPPKVITIRAKTTAPKAAFDVCCKPKMSIETLIKNSCSAVGEGPHWDVKSSTLLYVDIYGGGIHRWNSTTGKDESIHIAGDPAITLVVPCKTGGYIIGRGRTLSHLDWDTQKVTVLHEVEKGTNHRFNDGKCDASGRLWAGTMGHEITPGHVEPEVGFFYSLEKDGSLRQQLDKVSISNGLAWAPDNKTMYYIDSIPRKVFAFDFDLESGNISNRRVCVDFGDESTLPTHGLPDGMCIDTEGMLWVACYGAGKVIRFDPKSGKELQTLNFPAKKTTCCCFGGKNLDELYVTCAKFGLSDDEFRNNQPLAGSVFRVTGLGVKGYPPFDYEGDITAKL